MNSQNTKYNAFVMIIFELTTDFHIRCTYVGAAHVCMHEFLFIFHLSNSNELP